MSKRSAADAGLDAKSSAGRREMQGSGHDGHQHSLDSDEEQEYEQQRNHYEVLRDDDIEGQEDDTIQRDGEIQITPFNLKEEQEEGQFSKDGNFIWNKANKEIKDAWLDNIDWVKIKSTKDQAKHAALLEADDDKEDQMAAAYNEPAAYQSMLGLMSPGESVAKAIRRLAGTSMGKKRQQDQRKMQQKIKKGLALTPDEEQMKADIEAMSKLTGLADSILSRSGNMGIYDETYEKIAYRVKMSKTAIPDGTNDDEALDMFADNFKDKPAGSSRTEPPQSSDLTNLDDVVKWEFRWKNEDGAEIHGPHTSEEMLEWQQSGFFDKGVFVRRVDRQQVQFVDSKRIDFDLYTS